MFGFLIEERRNRRDPEEHPSPETLTAYQANELSSEEDERVQGHIAICEHCTEMLLELEEFLEPPAMAAEPAADFEAAADSKRLQPGLDEERQRRSQAPRRSARPLTYAMVAALLVATLGISVYTLSNRPERLQTLEPLNSYRSGTSAMEVVQLPVTLLLKLPTKTPYPEYQAKLRDQNGHLVREFSKLRESRSFDLELPLDQGTLDSGEYRIELLGLSDGRSDLAGEYAFKVAGR